MQPQTAGNSPAVYDALPASQTAGKPACLHGMKQSGFAREAREPVNFQRTST